MVGRGSRQQHVNAWHACGAPSCTGPPANQLQGQISKIGGACNGGASRANNAEGVGESRVPLTGLARVTTFSNSPIEEDGTFRKPFRHLPLAPPLGDSSSCLRLHNHWDTDRRLHFEGQFVNHEEHTGRTGRSAFHNETWQGRCHGSCFQMCTKARKQI